MMLPPSLIGVVFAAAFALQSTFAFESPMDKVQKLARDICREDGHTGHSHHSLNEHSKCSV